MQQTHMQSHTYTFLLKVYYEVIKVLLYRDGHEANALCQMNMDHSVSDEKVVYWEQRRGNILTPFSDLPIQYNFDHLHKLVFDLYSMHTASDQNEMMGKPGNMASVINTITICRKQ